MSTANEATLVNTVYRADSHTLAAAGAERVIDGGEVILNGNSAVRTGLLTLHTTDTAVGAVLTYSRALIVVGALNNNTGGVIDEVNDTVGTLSYTDAAADTLLGVNSCHTVFNGDSILRTSHSTVTVAKTSKVTYSVAAVRHVGGKTGLVTLEVKLLVYHVAGAVAGNESNLLDNILSLNAENCRDLLSGAVTAGNAVVGLGRGLVSQRLSIGVTAGEAAGAAVGAGQTLTDSYGGFILLYREEYSGKGEEHRTEKSDTYKKKHGE